ncbi:MAG: RNA pseudouridine synthase [Spirochaetales bacterium]|nr:RNA pseudouridine synthase [Spirochaetales bacterium]MBR6234666.1 RNA pseudouridine synthase [Spirochaetales bacterium]
MLVVYENNDFLIADKPHEVPTVPLKSQDMEGTLLGMVAARYPDILCVRGINPWEYGTVHRLDTATAGLVIFARTQEAYEYLCSIQRRHLMEKTYTACVEPSDRLKGFEKPDADTFEIISYFRSYGPKSKEVRAVQDIRRADSPVLYRTKVKDLGDNIMECTITRGFRHQIRVHLAWAGIPIVGDPLYGKQYGQKGTLELDCRRISFPLEDGNHFTFTKPSGRISS